MLRPFQILLNPPLSDSCALPTPPHAVPHERDQWQQPLEAHAISERGKAAAAAELAKQLQGRIRQRGCKEEFVPNADLLAEGQVSGPAASRKHLTRVRAFSGTGPCLPAPCALLVRRQLARAAAAELAAHARPAVLPAAKRTPCRPGGRWAAKDPSTLGVKKPTL